MKKKTKKMRKAEKAGQRLEGGVFLDDPPQTRQRTETEKLELMEWYEGPGSECRVPVKP